MDFQNTRFKLAECKTEARIGRVFLDHCIERFMAGDARRPHDRAWPSTGSPIRECRIVDECVQLHGGYGYMAEYPIARMWTDSRVQRIYAGTNEIMKEVIGFVCEYDASAPAGSLQAQVDRARNPPPTATRSHSKEQR